MAETTTNSRETGGKEATMATTSPITAVPAREAGALDGFEAVCSCGLRLSSSLETCLRADVASHLAWHQEVGR